MAFSVRQRNLGRILKQIREEVEHELNARQAVHAKLLEFANRLEPDHQEQQSFPADRDSEIRDDNGEYLRYWKRKISHTAEKLKNKGFQIESEGLWTFWEQIEYRDEITGECDFDIEELLEWIYDAIGHVDATEKADDPLGSSFPKESQVSVASNSASQPSHDRIEVDLKECRVRLDDMWHEVSPDAALLFSEWLKSHPKPVIASHLDGDIRPKRVKNSLPRPLKELFHSARGKGCWLEF